MSAEMLTPDGEPAEGGRAFRFRMEHPIPPYLIALGVGDLAFRELGPRTGVWTEPAMLDRAAYELAELEKFVSAAESLYGPYRWGRYDILMLPPSFPFGGMENPRLTFATPTILAGDRSLVSLVAHELAHSWSGNLVTNATWNDFWLNEGFTTYFENRIMEALYGPERAAMLANLGWQELQDAVKEAGGPAAPDTRLKLDLSGRDPDEGTTNIAYEKGATFLRTIEHAVGRERFDAYLRSYFDRHAFQPMTTEGMLADMRANLFRGDTALERRIGLDQWAYQPGVPANAWRRRRGRSWAARPRHGRRPADGARRSGSTFWARYRRRCRPRSWRTWTARSACRGRGTAKSCLRGCRWRYATATSPRSPRWSSS
jgi:leukotriene-A4 hydrolase